MTGSVDRLAPWLVVAIFIVSRAVFLVAGVRFDTGQLYGNWQFVDPALLEADLWRSLWNLHAQPPLFNLFIGIGLKLFGDGLAVFAAVVFALVALLAYLALQAILRRAGFGPVAALVATVVFMVGPPAILYENWLFYTGPVAWFLILAAYAVLRFAETGRFGWALAVFALVAAVVLTRSAFHLVWMAAIVVGFLVVRPAWWRTTTLAALVPLLVVVGLYAKNAALFSTFGSSSWMGLSLAKLAVGHVPDPVRADLVERGIFSRLALLPEFARPDAYETVLGTVAPTGVPVLDQRRKFSGHINYNHAIYPAASRVLWRDSLAGLRHFPKAMAWALMKSSYYYTLAPADYAFLDSNRERIATYETAYDLAVYGKLPRFLIERFAGPIARGSALEQATRMSPTVILALALTLGGGALLLLAVVRRGFRARPEEVMLLFIWATLLYLSIVCVTIEVFENNRMRYEVEPYLYIGALAVVARLFRRSRPATPGAAT